MFWGLQSLYDAFYINFTSSVKQLLVLAKNRLLNGRTLVSCSSGADLLVSARTFGSVVCTFPTGSSELAADSAGVGCRPKNQQGICCGSATRFYIFNGIVTISFWHAGSHIPVKMIGFSHKI